MSQSIKTPKSVAFTLAGGFVMGGICMAAVYGGAVDKALATLTPQVKPRLMSMSSAESLTELHNLDNSFRSLAKFVGPAVVDIKSMNKRAMAPDGSRMPEQGGEGSGFLFSPDGYIATNDHVVGTADTVTVTLKDGRQYQGKVVRANDRNSDIALVKIDAKNLPYLSFADGAKVEPGEFVMAIGAPFGLENTVTVGHISALGRDSQIENHVYTDLLQTDAAINMGNSGGPLVNVDGQVVGMNTAIYSPTGGSNGIGFAIRGTQVKLIENLLITKGKVVRSMLGVLPEDVKEYERNENPALAAGGARVEQVAGEPAKSAGLKKDDVIIRIGSTAIHDQTDLRNAMLVYNPGETVPVEILRNGKKETLNVKLLQYTVPAQPTAPQERSFGGSPKTYEFGSPFQGMPNPFGGDPFQQGPQGQQDPQGNSDGQNAPAAPHTGPVRLGVQVGDPTESNRDQLGIPSGVQGAVVVGVQPGSVANSIGLQAGDVVQSFNGKTIATARDLTDAIKSIKWGDVAHISYVHYTTGGKALKTETDVQF
jgi:serine protease Do